MYENTTYLFEENSFTDLTLYQFGRESCAPMLSCGPAAHNHFLLHFILSGKGSFTINETAYPIHTGQAFLIFPGHTTLYTADRIDPWTYIWIEFDGLKAEPYLTQAGFSLKTPVFTPTSTEGSDEIRSLMMRFLEHHDNPLKLMGTLYYLLDALILHCGIAKIKKAGTIQEFYIHEAMLYIERHYKEEISVSQLADWCAINRSYFGKIFRNTVLMTPQNYIIRYRMSKACELLRDSELSIREIALEVGYSNQMNFSRAFRNEYEVTPSEWRKQARLTCK